ncbi:hypothetical protein POV27_07715 [Aureisphaera galaxeae]|uniref:glycoside hydrolase family 113 n=1 Tax=Aureisphaera galaxeae TaxID=1538023 RepID=UPI002350E271|nr:hypothetical protein [Aureisphaera galaxeae]MDC8003935.1 hypothetical protein [Aureisphaera galaxeae]
MKKGLLSIFLFIGLLIVLLVYSQDPVDVADPKSIGGITNIQEKQRGAHVFSTVDTTNAHMFRKMNLEWVAFVPWGFQDQIDSPEVTHHNGDSTYIKQHNEHWVRKITEAREAGFKVFFKPHVWIDRPADGKWRSDIFPKNDADWEQWQETYRNFILRYAQVAEQAQAEMFCVGVEFTRLALEKPDFWRELIAEIREVYSGKLTYGANWYEEYETIPFWDALDYIGIQAYFPLTDHEYPSAIAISEGWNTYLPTLDSLHKKFDRPILFTEMGYKSTSDGAMKPWEWMDNPYHPEYHYSLETQANSYLAFFNTIWNKEWFAGVHIWQLRSDFQLDPEKQNKDFTPQGKPAESIIAKGFQN